MFCGIAMLAGLVRNEAALKEPETSFSGGRNVRIERRTRVGARVVLLLCALGMMLCGVARADDPVYDIDVPAMNAAEALNRLAEQTGAIMLFSYDLASTRRANAVRGRYTLLESLDLLLRGTGLSGGLSDKGVVDVSRVENGQRHGEDEAMLDKRSFRTRFAAFVTSMFSISAASGQDADQRSQTLEEIVVTANKREERAIDVAASVQVANAELIDRVAATRLTEYAAFVPGLQVQPGVNAGQQTVILRGIVPQQSAPTVSTYVDDVAVGGTSNQGGGAIGLPDIDPAELERVEVLNGPQGTLYGASSLGGVVKFVTRKPNLRDFEASVSADGYAVAHGDVGTEARARLSAPLIGDTLALSISGHHRREPGFIDDVGLYGKDANDGETYGGRASLLYQPGDATEVRLSAMYSKRQSNATDAIIIDSLTREPLYGDYEQRHLAFAEGSNELKLYSATINHTFGEGGPTLTSATSYSDVTLDMVGDPFNFFEAYFGLPIPTAMSRTVFPLEQVTQELRLTSAKNGRFEWLVGGYYQREHGEPDNRYFATDPDGSIRTLDAPFDPLYVVQRNYRVREFAAFGNASYYFTPALWLTVGYRYSDIDQHDRSARSGFFGNPTNPAVALTNDFRAKENKSTYLGTLSYKPTDDSLLYVRAASGYRPGGTRTRPPGAPADFSTSFDSDSIWNYEVGVKQSWPAQRINAGLAVFLIDWTDIQQNFRVGDSSFNAPGNGGRARSRGVEASIGGEPVDGLHLTANVTFTDGEFREANPANDILQGQQLPEVSKWSGGLAAEYEWQLAGSWDALVGGDVQYKSKNINVQRYSQDGYSIVGLHVGTRSGGFRATLYVKNLFDQYRYLSGVGTVADTLLPFEAVLLQPRTIGVALSQEF